MLSFQNFGDALCLEGQGLILATTGENGPPLLSFRSLYLFVLLPLPIFSIICWSPFSLFTANSCIFNWMQIKETNSFV